MVSRRAVRLVLVLAVSLAAWGIVGGASAASVTGTMKLDPATTQVDNGGTFNINVTSNTTVPTSGVSASITFDKAILQVTSITRSSAWTSASLYLAADAKAIATANQKGVLKGVTAAFFPPTSVPAGSQSFITVGFKATACGTVNLGLPIGTTNSDTTLLDGRSATYGNAIKLTTTGATVTVCQGGAGASGSPGASGGASAGPTDSGGVGPSATVDPNSSASAAPGDSSQPAASGAAPSAGAPAAPTDNGSGGTTADQSGWLTFAMAALAVAAAGLATLILVLTIVAIAAAVTGAIVVIRVWRRYNQREATAASVTTAMPSGDTPAAASESAPAEGAVAADPTTGDGAADGPSAERASPAETAPPPPTRQP